VGASQSRPPDPPALATQPVLPHLIGSSDPRLSPGYERIDRHAAVGKLLVAPATPERRQQVVVSTEALEIRTNRA
jgi:hypothetical protein